MDKIFNFLLPALIAGFCSIITFLIGQSIAAACFAGVCCGISVAIAFEFGKNDGFEAKYILTELAGGIVGGAFGALMFLAKG